MRAAIYARYSTDLQRDASIEDQVRICHERIVQEGWALTATYADAASSGASPAAPRISEAARGRQGRCFRRRGGRGPRPALAATRSTWPRSTSSWRSPGCSS